MTLPVVPRKTGTETVGGQVVTFRSLNRAEAIKVTTEFHGKPDDAEIFILACGCDVTEDEARAWRMATDQDEAGTVIDGICYLSGLAKRNDPNGKPIDPQPNTSAI